MDPSLSADHQGPASSRTQSAPPSARTLAAMPPPAPEPTMHTSYVLVLVCICMRDGPTSVDSDRHETPGAAARIAAAAGPGRADGARRPRPAGPQARPVRL